MASLGFNSNSESLTVFGPALPRTPSPSPNQGSHSSLTKPHIDMPLHIAVRDNQGALVCAILDEGADIEALDAHGSTALYIAAEKGYIDIARHLIECGASVHMQCRDRPELRPWSILQIAAAKGRTEIVHLLLERGAEVDGHAEGFPPPLSEAIYEGHVDVTRLLLEHGANLVVRADDNLTALHVAVSAYNQDNTLDIVSLLINHGADLNALDMSGTSALDLAVKSASTSVGLAIVQFLLEQGADFHAPSVVHSAAWQGNSGILRLLRARGADMTALNDRGWTSLHNAMMVPRKEPEEAEVVNILLRYGVDPNARANDPEGLTAVHLAAWNGNTECLRLLLKSGATVDGVARGKGTPLHCSVTLDLAGPSAVRLLLDHGASLDALDEDGLTVKQVARMKGTKHALGLLGLAPSGLPIRYSLHDVSQAGGSSKSSESGMRILEQSETPQEDWYHTVHPYFLKAEQLRRQYLDTPTIET